jgi:hypothetical protein
MVGVAPPLPRALCNAIDSVGPVLDMIVAVMRAGVECGAVSRSGGYEAKDGTSCGSVCGDCGGVCGLQCKGTAVSVWDVFHDAVWWPLREVLAIALYAACGRL